MRKDDEFTSEGDAIVYGVTSARSILATYFTRDGWRICEEFSKHNSWIPGEALREAVSSGSSGSAENLKNRANEILYTKRAAFYGGKR